MQIMILSECLQSHMVARWIRFCQCPARPAIFPPPESQTKPDACNADYPGLAHSPATPLSGRTTTSRVALSVSSSLIRTSAGPVTDAIVTSGPARVQRRPSLSVRIDQVGTYWHCSPKANFPLPSTRVSMPCSDDNGRRSR